jgi:bifunctional DNA-binding transcriptional regulator/antitoxin component of YhaV-PrlF toxin-antitoxin module
MQMKVVSLSPRGQLVIPAAILRAMGIKGRTDLAIVQEGDHVVMMKASDLGKKVVDDLEGFEALGLSAFEELWDNPEDEVWNDA